MVEVMGGRAIHRSLDPDETDRCTLLMGAKTQPSYERPLPLSSHSPVVCLALSTETQGSYAPPSLFPGPCSSLSHLCLLCDENLCPCEPSIWGCRFSSHPMTGHTPWLCWGHSIFIAVPRRLLLLVPPHLFCGSPILM